MERSLADMDALNKKLRTRAELVPGLEERLRAAEKDLSVAGKSMSAQLKDLAEARQTAADLEEEKQKLTDEVRRVRQAAENRFAGIALGGKRVAFLVDTSGSMEMVDEQTPDPAKWPGVRETVVKVLRSLPAVEKFQVIRFADKPTYLFGTEEWMDYDPVASAARVEKALAAVKPQGPTNMYAALEAAFRLRDGGLDTVYLLSDGLPNTGPGLSAEAARAMPEVERGTLLGRQVRQVLKTDWNRTIPGRTRVRIHTIGFFYESPDLGAFLWALARENDGSFVGMSKP
jgi:hypothetical protein